MYRLCVLHASCTCLNWRRVSERKSLRRDALAALHGAQVTTRALGTALSKARGCCALLQDVLREVHELLEANATTQPRNDDDTSAEDDDDSLSSFGYDAASLSPQVVAFAAG